MRAFDYKLSLKLFGSERTLTRKIHEVACLFAAKNDSATRRPLPHIEMLYGYFEVYSAPSTVAQFWSESQEGLICLF